MKSSKKASKSGRRVAAAQSDQHGWEWSQQYGNYFRTYTDGNGDVQYEWQATTASTTPRTGIEDLEDATAQLQVGDDGDQPMAAGSPSFTFATPHTGEGAAYEAGVTSEPTEEGDYLTASQAQALQETAGKSSRRTSRTQDQRPARANKDVDKKGKGKALASNEQLRYPISRPVRSNTAPATTGGDGTANEDEHPQDPGYGYQQLGRAATASTFNQSSGTVGLRAEEDPQDQLELPEQMPDPGDFDEPAYDTMESLSGEALLLKAQQGYSRGTVAQLQRHYSEGSYAESSSSQSTKYVAESEEDNDGSTTPIYPAQLDSETLDPRYVKEDSYKFDPGEVFLSDWPEVAGETMKAGYVPSHVSVTVRGQTIYTSPRRFIVIGNDKGHATCVPIYTYGKKACTKNGVKPEKHGIIHNSWSNPTLLPKEPALGFAPIRFESRVQDQSLSKESRVDYSQLMTVKHNVKVFFIGRVHREDLKIVRNAVDKCWREKVLYKEDKKQYRQHKKR